MSAFLLLAMAMMMEAPMEKLIQDLAAVQIEAGEAVQPAATDKQLADARAALRDRFGASLPDGYADLLRQANGVDFDGIVLYGAGPTRQAPGPGGFWQGLAEANALWRDGPGHNAYLVLGETDMDLLTVDPDGANAVLRDKVSSDVNEEFFSVRDAVRRMLGSRL